MFIIGRLGVEVLPQVPMHAQMVIRKPLLRPAKAQNLGEAFNPGSLGSLDGFGIVALDRRGTAPCGTSVQPRDWSVRTNHLRSAASAISIGGSRKTFPCLETTVGGADQFFGAGAVPFRGRE